MTKTTHYDSYHGPELAEDDVGTYYGDKTTFYSSDGCVWAENKGTTAADTV